MREKEIIGIYKVESPSGKIYVGQSLHIKRRFKSYKYINQGRDQRCLWFSLRKYGWGNHKFSVLHELPVDISIDILTTYEQFYIDQYKQCGFQLMNINKATTRGRHSLETKEKLSKLHKGKTIPEAQRKRHSALMKGRTSPQKGKTHTEEAKAMIKAKRALQVMPKGYKRDKPVWNKGKKGLQVGHNKGKTLSPETREKIRQKLLGSKLSSETIAKRTATLKINGVKRRWTDQAKKRQSERYLGKKKSPETLEKLRRTLMLKKLNQINNALPQ